MQTLGCCCKLQMVEDSAYVKLSGKVKAIEQSSTFQRLVFISIFITGLLVGIQSDTSLNALFVVKIVDWILIGFFCCECAFKIIGEREGPFLYLSVITAQLSIIAATRDDSWLLVGIMGGGCGFCVFAFATGTKLFIHHSWDWAWTVMDVSITVILLTNPWLSIDTFPFATLRLLRLLRFHKILKVLPPHLKLVGAGLLGGCWSLAYICIIFGLFLFLFALAGMYFLQSNDPMHFGSLPLAMLTWFQVCTLEDWTDIMYTSIYGCEDFDGESRHFLMDSSSSAHLVSDFASSHFWRPMCQTPNTHLVLGPLLFTSVVLLGGVVMRALLAASVVLAMTKESGANAAQDDDFTLECAVEETYWRQYLRDPLERKVLQQQRQQRKQQHFNLRRLQGGSNGKAGRVAPLVLPPTPAVLDTLTIRVGPSAAEQEGDARARSDISGANGNIDGTKGESPARGGTTRGTAPCDSSADPTGSSSEVRAALSSRWNVRKDKPLPEAPPVKLLRKFLQRELAGQQQRRGWGMWAHHVSKSGWYRGWCVLVLLCTCALAASVLALEETSSGSSMSVDHAMDIFSTHWVLTLTSWLLFAFELFVRAMAAPSAGDTISTLAKSSGGTSSASGKNAEVGGESACSDGAAGDEGDDNLNLRTKWQHDAAGLTRAQHQKLIALAPSKAYYGLCFDGFVLSASIVPAIFGWRAAPIMLALRLLRLPAMLQLHGLPPVLQETRHALIHTMLTLRYHALLLTLFVFMSAVLGNQMFAMNDERHFGSLAKATLTVFNCLTLQDWARLMHLNMFGCENYQFSSASFISSASLSSNSESSCGIGSNYAWGWGAAVYFVVFALIGAFLLTTIAVGAAVTSMTHLRMQRRVWVRVETALDRVLEVGHEKGWMAGVPASVEHAVIEQYRQVFDALDVDGNGALGKSDLEVALIAVFSSSPSAHYPSPAEITAIFRDIVDPRSGSVTFSQLLRVLVRTKGLRLAAASNKALGDKHNSVPSASPWASSDGGAVSTAAGASSSTSAAERIDFVFIDNGPLGIVPDRSVAGTLSRIVMVQGQAAELGVLSGDVVVAINRVEVGANVGKEELNERMKSTQRRPCVITVARTVQGPPEGSWLGGTKDRYDNSNGDSEHTANAGGSNDDGAYAGAAGSGDVDGTDDEKEDESAVKEGPSTADEIGQDFKCWVMMRVEAAGDALHPANIQRQLEEERARCKALREEVAAVKKLERARHDSLREEVERLTMVQMDYTQVSRAGPRPPFEFRGVLHGAQKAREVGAAARAMFQFRGALTEGRVAVPVESAMPANLSTPTLSSAFAFAEPAEADGTDKTPDRPEVDGADETAGQPVSEERMMRQAINRALEEDGFVVFGEEGDLVPVADEDIVSGNNGTKRLAKMGKTPGSGAVPMRSVVPAIPVVPAEYDEQDFELLLLDLDEFNGTPARKQTRGE
jgi:hypothetical protein